MPQWGNIDFVPSGNNKPKFANTANVYGVNVSESRSTTWSGKGVAPGWVQVIKGTGGVASIDINVRGAGYNSNGYIIFTGGGGGSGANASFIARSNTANSTDNVIISVTVNNQGSGYTNTPVATANVSNTVAASFIVYMNGKANRKMTEQLVVMNDVTNDVGGNDNSVFPDQ